MPKPPKLAGRRFKAGSMWDRILRRRRAPPAQGQGPPAAKSEPHPLEAKHDAHLAQLDAEVPKPADLPRRDEKADVRPAKPLVPQGKPSDKFYGNWGRGKGGT